MKRAWLAVPVVVVLAALAGYPVYVRPSLGDVSAAAPADAVIALGGEPAVGLYASQLRNQGIGRELILSNPYGDPYGSVRNSVTDLCRDAVEQPEKRITCFVPDPSTTRGEAEEIGRLAAARGWKRIVVVTVVFHVSRAHLIVGRCFGGEIDMLAFHPQAPWFNWIYQYGYQTAGYLQAAVLRDC